MLLVFYFINLVLFKQVTVDDSPTGLRLISSDLTDTLRNTYRYRNRVSLLKIPDGNSFNGLLDKSLSRNKDQIIKIYIYIKIMLYQFMLDQLR